MMLRRMTAQFHQINSLFQSTFGVIPQQSSQREDLVRDKFGLHKMIVAATTAGKVYNS